MQRIIVYVQNEEFEALKPLMDRLRKQGALVAGHSVKWEEPVKADVVLTYARHESVVKHIFAGTSVPIQIIEEGGGDLSEAAPDPVADHRDAVLDVEEKVADHEPAEVVEPEVVEEELPIVMTVAEDVTPTRPRRRATSE